MLETLKTVAPYLGIGVAGIVIWSVLKNGVPAAYSAVKGVFTKGAADLKALESRVTTLETKLKAYNTPAVPPAAVVMPAATGAVGATGAH